MNFTCYPRQFVFSLAMWLVSSLLVTESAYSQSNYFSAAPTYSLADITSVNANVFSTAQNPAHLGTLQSHSAALGINNRFSVSEFSYLSAAYQHNLSTGGLGVAVQNFGLPNYSENQAFVSYGLPLAKSFYAGASINYQNLKIGENAQQFTQLSAGFGLLVNASEQLTFATQVLNITTNQTQNLYNTSPVIEIGAKYTIDHNFSVQTAFWKVTSGESQYKVAGSYQPSEKFQFQYGILISEFLVNTFGIQYKQPKWSAYLSGQIHPVLGLSTAVSAAYLFGKTTDEE